jgi:hypothetical protein
MALPVVLKASQRMLPITIKTRGVLLDKNLERVVFKNVRSALGRFCRRVRHVSVWIEDTNGPREGSGIQCRMLVALTPGGRLSVIAEAANEYAAMADCARRARTILDRFVKRRRVKRRARARR